MGLLEGVIQTVPTRAEIVTGLKLIRLAVVVVILRELATVAATVTATATVAVTVAVALATAIATATATRGDLDLDVQQSATSCHTDVSKVVLLKREAVALPAITHASVRMRL